MTETVIEALRRNSGNTEAVIDPGRTSLSSGELIERAERIGGQLATLGIGPNATTATVLPNGVAAAQVYLMHSRPVEPHRSIRN
jgi:non-ribosomal peptide synthetase component E (peptide arylation enzyme)